MFGLRVQRYVFFLYLQIFCTIFLGLMRYFI